MPSRTTTSDLDTVSFILPSGTPTIHFPSSDPSHNIITIPPHCYWSPGPHWHERYTEHLRIIKGTVLVTINNTNILATPDSPTISIPKFTIHNFRRPPNSDPAEEIVIEESTDPADGFKQVFFRNIASALLDQPKLGWVTTMTQLFVTIAFVDNYIVILPWKWVPFVLNYWLCHVLYLLVESVGRWRGYRGWCEEYTPRELWAIAGTERKRR